MGSVSALLLVLAGVAPVAPVAATQPTSMNLVATSEVYFSSAEQTDRIVASVKGASCEDAIFEVSIRHQAAELFHWSNPLIPQTCEWLKRAPDEAKWALKNMVNAAVGPVRAANRSCGPPQEIGCVASPILERLRRADVPLVCFTTGAESAKCVAFDPETKTVVEVWRYSE
jgi:hypothetical protein